MLERIELGAGSGDAEIAIIWLHGLGADGHDFVPIVPELALEPTKVRFVFPHAPMRAVTINAGMTMRAWYDIRSLDLDSRSHDEAGILKSRGQVQELIDAEVAAGMTPDRIFLAGFSQGGAVALFTALTTTQPLAGVLALSSYLLLGDQVPTAGPNPPPIFMGHGQLDPVVPMRIGQMSCTALRRLGYDVEWHTYPVPHGVHPDEIRAIGTWLRRQFARVPNGQ